MIGNLPRFVVSWIRERKDRPQFSDLAVEIRHDLLVPFVGFDLAQHACLQIARHFVKIPLLVELQGVFEFGSQVALPPKSVAVPNGEFGLLAFKHEG